MNVPDILATLPHRPPMLMVDRVIEVVPGERLTAVKAVSLNEPWYAQAATEGDPQRLEYPRALLIESWGQAAAVLACASPQDDSAGDGVPLFGAMTGLRFHRPVFPGDLLVHRVRLARHLGDNMIFDGDTVCDGETVITVQRVVLAFRPAAVVRPGDGADAPQSGAVAAR